MHHPGDFSGGHAPLLGLSLSPNFWFSGLMVWDLFLRNWSSTRFFKPPKTYWNGRKKNRKKKPQKIFQIFWVRAVRDGLTTFGTWLRPIYRESIHWREASQIGHFRVPKNFHFQNEAKCKTFLVNEFFCVKMNIILRSMASHLASL